jgi:drug/metabolite transporter (DMT)-like permease
LDKSEIKAYLAWVSICIVWGTTYLAIKIGVETVPPMLFAGLRWIIAGPILFLFLILVKVKVPPKKEIKHLVLIGILLIGFANGFLVIAEKWVPSGLASLLITTLPFWVVGIESFLPNKPSFNKFILLGLLIGFAGVSLIFISDFENLVKPGYIIGILSILGSIIVWSSGSIYAKYKKFNSSPIMRASIQMITAGILQLVLALILGEFKDFSIDRNGFLAIIYLVIFGSFLGYVAYIYAISILPVAFVSTYSYINPVIALFLGWYFLNEKIDFSIIVGTIIIFSGVALVQYGSRKNLRKT